jgi:hypothetical protein
MRAAFEDGDREGARRQRDIVVALGDELNRRQKSFDDTLKSFLGKEQWKRYDKWRSEERKRAEQERRERWEGVRAARSRREGRSVSTVTATPGRRR